MITHDHRGRPLSPAMSELLSSTVIPCPKQSRFKRPTLASLKGSVPSSFSLSSSSSLANLSLSPETPPTMAGLSDMGGDDDDDDDDDVDAVLAMFPVGKDLSSNKIPPYTKSRSSNTLRRKYSASIASSNSSAGSPEDLNDGEDESEYQTTSIVADTEEFFSWSWMDEFKKTRTKWGNDDLDVASENSTPNSLSSSPIRRAALRRVELSVEECTDHPLSSPEDNADSSSTADDDGAGNSDIDVSTTSKSLKEEFLAKSFVSNLTKSLKAMANSFSSQERIHATQIFAFSPRSTDEPIPSRISFARSNPPSVASVSDSSVTATASSSATRQASQQAPLPSKPERKKSINLKTYAVESTLIPHFRPREIRLNSAFYRVYAVETLMRKNGKLNSEFQGRATMILEPRTDAGMVKAFDDEPVFGIRKRLIEDRSRNDCRWHVISSADLNNDEIVQSVVANPRGIY